MRIRRFAQWIGIPLLLWLGVACRAAAAPPSLAEADRDYVRKSYAAALSGYERALQAGQVSAERRDEVEYRITVALGKTHRWDRALEQSLAFVKAHRGTVWEPRGLYWLGRLYLAAPHQGFRVEGRLYRGDNVPRVASDDTPESVDVTDQDAQNALDALEAARVLYPAYRTASHTAAEEVQLNYDLFRVLEAGQDFTEWATKQKWLPPGDPTWKVNPAEAYSPQWEPPKKRRYLFAQIEALAPQTPHPAHTKALALLARALWLIVYQQQMTDSYAVRYYDHGKPILIPYPYQDEQPSALLHQIVRDYPDDAIRDQVQLLSATLLERDGKYLAELAAFRRLIAERPHSKWVSDAHAHIQEIMRPQLKLLTQPLGPPSVWVISRNARRLHFAVYRVRLETILARSQWRRDPRRDLSSFQSVFGDLRHAARLYGPRVAQWDLSTHDTGKHLGHRAQVRLPVKAFGAFVVVVSAPGVRAASLVTISDLTLVQKVHRDGALYYVAEAQTGKPVAGAHLLVKQWWGEANKARCAIVRGVTAANGLLNVPFRRGPKRSDFQSAALAYLGDRCALVGTMQSSDYGDNPGTIRVYSTTDRSVYRPLQTVYYRQLVLRRQRGGLLPVAHQRVKVEISDPNGKTIFRTIGNSSAFGSVSGQFVLTAGCPLGEYTVQVTVPHVAQEQIESGSNQFRVEEYKKPEFAVTVTPEAERVRLGQPTGVKIGAKYYFGGPVPRARVTYRVYRNTFAQTYQFPHKYDFLYNAANNGDYDTDYRQGEVIAQGMARTNDNGEARITFPTKADGDRWRDSDLSYTVEADVQDASRRTISGSGQVKATRHDVAVFLDYPHGYATQGDRVDVEVRTLNPSDQPVAVTGTAQVFRQPETPDSKEKLVHQEPLATDAHGYAIFHWMANRAGYYRIAFVTHDSAQEKVDGSVYVWVEGPDLARGRFLFQKVFLAARSPYYEEGQAARVLLVTPAPNCTVLLTREANNEILDRQVIHVPGHSLELTVPLTHRDVPNVFLCAVLVRDGQVYQAASELFVPPTRQFTDVAVQTDKAQYQPGEKATLHLQARDWQGRPLRTELCVSIADAALNYIQKDYAPDIRAFFYGDRRSESISANDSTGLLLQVENETTQALLPFKLHDFTLPDGLGQIFDWSGNDQVLSSIEPDYAFSGNSWIGDDTFGQAGAPRPRLTTIAGIGRDSGIWGGHIDPTSGKPIYAPVGMAPDTTRPFSPQDEGNVNMLLARIAVKKSVPKSEMATPTLRSKFLDTAFWTPAVVTDTQGNATVTVTWPDNLTQWRAHAIGNTKTAQVGTGETSVTTKKDLIVRLQAPRFCVEGDEVVLSANVQNYLPTAAHVKVRLDLSGDTAEIVRSEGLFPALKRRSEMQSPPARTPMQPAKADLAFQNGDLSPSAVDTPETWVDIPQNGEKRVDWTVRAQRQGALRIRMTAQAEAAADATEAEVPILIYGAERATAQSGVLREGIKKAELAITLPEARKPHSAELIVQLDPSLSGVMLDALPYLENYPYGCVEQTLSRFVPSVLVAKTLQDLGYNLKDIHKRAQREATQRQMRGSLPIANSPYTYPQGRPGTMQTPELAEEMEDRSHNPVFDSQMLKKMVAEGLARLAVMQHADGGWGWWPDDPSDAYMSACVLYGLLTARQVGTAVPARMLARGLHYLRARFLEEDDMHRMAYAARILAMDPGSRNGIHVRTTGFLYDHRERLSAYSKALLALALHDLGDIQKATILLDNLETTANVDEANGTANWEENDTTWWRWYNNKVETNAAILQAYMAIRPGAHLAPLLMKWLVNNRRANAWNTTQETAMAVYALADYARVNRELAPDYTLTVDLGGRIRRTYTVTHANALDFDNRFVVPDALLQTGTQTLTITRQGRGTCYYTATTRCFSQEESLVATSNEIAVHRRYFRLLPGTASGVPQPKLLDAKRPNPFLTGRYELLTVGGEWNDTEDMSSGPRYQRVALTPDAALQSGDMIEVELQLEAKNDYDYVLFEDVKPAGCEPVELRSGTHAGGGLCSNMELRDQKVAFFLSGLPQGTRTLTYRLRAEAPGRFRVLPTNGYAMYAPDVRTLSDGMRLDIRDAEVSR
jgi:uncharacterized protein YfaS (alpha-2-macroglobulin family)